ncbi:uncharacterized protein LOC112050194 isoform X1 [Bicyclus anynana]|uniref:Uncharacterized protein LOC112050194 isoform X1 n=1 Tax=Bicyclus anynana TaxID=110368 RepID=A0A6J1NB67_BICAN|nr:uncharacterized protein LOC112050194 isoform X1 [Bicyclus anynana]
MRRFVILSAVILQISWCYAYPGPAGVGAYAYQDSNGHRYGGTYDLKDNINPFRDPFASPFNDVDAFFPDYFRNYENLLQQIFADIETQRLASYAAQKAYDLTFNQAGYHTNFLRFPNFGGFPFFGAGPMPFNMPHGSHNAAFAGAAAGPGYRHQVAGIDPINSNIPNVNVVERFNDEERSNNPGKFYSVSSSSFASSSNIDGKVAGHREAETVVNDNGKITKYKVHS